MQKALTLMDTTVGKKAALAVSGLVLFGFVFVHMVGNLQVFQGREVFNHYAETLKSMPSLLWGTRTVVATSVIVHVAMMIQLYSRSFEARPTPYKVQKSVASSYSSATMKYTGPLILCYLIFHILHFTAPGTGFGYYEHSFDDPYGNFVSSFQVPWIALFYVASNFFLSLHLFHGSWSLMQSMGLSHPRYNGLRKAIAQAVAFVITVGNISMPIAVLIGLVK